MGTSTTEASSILTVQTQIPSLLPIRARRETWEAFAVCQAVDLPHLWQFCPCDLALVAFALTSSLVYRVLGGRAVEISYCFSLLLDLQLEKNIEELASREADEMDHLWDKMYGPTCSSCGLSDWICGCYSD